MTFQNYFFFCFSSLGVKSCELHGSGCKKCPKESETVFIGQLAKWTIADLFNSVVTWSKDDDQLILPNYSDMPRGCRRQHVQSRFRCRTHFWHQQPSSTYQTVRSFKQGSMQEGSGKKPRGQRWKEGQGARWHASPSQGRFAQHWCCSNAEAICVFSQQGPCETRHVLLLDL